MTLDARPERLQALTGRRSVAPRRLGPPGPSFDQVTAAVEAGLRAPDHGGLLPWRVIFVPPEQHAALGRLFEATKMRRDPDASAADLARTRAQATGVPTLAAFVVRARPAPKVPLHEQWLSAGAALMNLLHAFDALGFGASLLSGDRCADASLRCALGLEADEVLAGFLSVGTVVEPPAPAKPKPVGAVLSVWPGADTPGLAVVAPARDGRPAPTSGRAFSRPAG